MSNYADIAKIFEEDTKNIDFFENAEVLSTKNLLIKVLDKNIKQLIFLIGEPGVGKSVFLNNIDKLLDNQYKIIKFETPLLDPVEFIKMLIKKRRYKIQDSSIEGLIKKVVSIYKDENYLITIDEAQLLSKNMLEIIRILADSKAFWFLLAMHKHQSKDILNEPQFSTRPHKVLELGELQKHECKDFIYKSLSNKELGPLAYELSAKYLNLIYKLTKGNFRNLKKLLYNLFLIMDTAINEDKQKYQRLSKCVLIMSAIESGLLDV